jgi:hypothetical protein
MLDDSAEAVRFVAPDEAGLKSDERWSPLLPPPTPPTTASM